MRGIFAAVFFALLAGGAAVDAGAQAGGAGVGGIPPEFADAEQAERYRRVISELRCLVCQNQNLADSNADLARDMREVAAQMIREGKSERAVADFMTARYGDFVLYRPPFRPATWLLWLGPAALVLLGIAAVALIVRRPRRAELGEEEKRRAAEILEGE